MGEGGEIDRDTKRERTGGTETQRPMKRGSSTLCLAATLHIPGDGSAKSAGRSIFSSPWLFFSLSFVRPSMRSFARARPELAPRGKSRRIDDPVTSISHPHVFVQSGLCLFLGSRVCGARARKPSLAGCFDLGECSLNVNEVATFFRATTFHFTGARCGAPRAGVSPNLIWPAVCFGIQREITASLIACFLTELRGRRGSARK